ncbi:MAG: NADP-dependent oxidoreductase [Desulfosarcina sp.]|jgi:NADPH:quinone reductase-like Zn-dependent oxidoreductase
MKACIIESFGGRDRLKIADLPTPEIGEGEVLVRIRAAGVNPVDWKIREGRLSDLFPHQFPLIPGWDMAGVVEAVGHSARRFAPGDEVYAYARRPVVQQGTYAEYIALPESYLSRKPEGLSMTEAASIPLATLTAYQALFDAGRLTAGQSVFILGASGGVGSSAVQLAAGHGCRVIGLASSRNHDYLTALGAEVVIDYERGDFIQRLGEVMPHGVDLVFDCHGGDTLERGLLCARLGGSLVSITETVEEDLLKQRDLRFAFTFVEPHAPQLDHIRDLIHAGRFNTHVSRTFKLDQAAQAHETIEAGHTRGKIVLTL